MKQTRASTLELWGIVGRVDALGRTAFLAHHVLTPDFESGPGSHLRTSVDAVTSVDIDDGNFGSFWPPSYRASYDLHWIVEDGAIVGLRFAELGGGSRFDGRYRD